VVARVVGAGVGGARVAEHGSIDRCPGARHAIATDDGALVRVRVPGGYLGAAALLALAALAQRYGDGALELTARANVQLRGLCADDLDAVSDVLVAVGLLPSVAHERVRNVAANPFAGVDPTELLDVRPYVAAFDRALVASAMLAALPAKFLVAFDGGGRGADRRGADLVAAALAPLAPPAAGGPPHFAIAIAGEARRLVVPANRVASVLLELAQHAVTLAKSSAAGSPCAATWRLATLPHSCDRIPAHLAGYVRPVSAGVALENAGAHALVAPLGVLAAADAAQANLVPAIALGRLSASQARAIALLALAEGADVRLGPWRGVVVGAFPRSALERAHRRFGAVELSLDGANGFAGVAACAGRGRCDAALADVRADATAYAARVAGAGDAPVRHVNFAGCEKRCAMRRGADVDLVATARGYDVFARGERVATALDAATAIALASERV